MRKKLSFLVLFLSLIACGKKDVDNINIGNGYSFKYEFAAKPQLGTTPLKINVFKDKKKSNDLKVIVSYDMPSMRGHHATPPSSLTANSNNDYLLPVNFVMRGGWEIVIEFSEGDNLLHKETILLNL
ncbi:MAG: hypothetical protein Ta2D_03090 [Rickettsiales bacterium]|nr:MAG: hypothetical protein Ta2D_03090 [Rickettsiales bacterium]